jgi:hypothetical protein
MYCYENFPWCQEKLKWMIPEEVRGVTETMVVFKADTAGAEDLEEVEQNDC